LYKIISSYPDVASAALPRLAEKLSDPDQGMGYAAAFINQLTVD